MYSETGALELGVGEKRRAIQKGSQKFPYAVRKTCTADSQSQKAGKPSS